MTTPRRRGGALSGTHGGALARFAGVMTSLGRRKESAKDRLREAEEEVQGIEEVEAAIDSLIAERQEMLAKIDQMAAATEAQISTFRKGLGDLQADIALVAPDVGTEEPPA